MHNVTGQFKFLRLRDFPYFIKKIKNLHNIAWMHAATRRSWYSQYYSADLSN